MKCHYEILDLSREADNTEIKNSYRKLALKWHPDKNLENTDSAKEQFQLVQQAYEVLSDPQERAWYDRHREQILRGADSEFQENRLDVFQYFTTTCFKGYTDTEKGFYAVYRGVFDSLIKEDIEFMDDKEEFCEIPAFGDSQSDYDEVVGPFYAYWSSYCTKKSYVWLDPHDIREFRERRILKLMEKENKKVRQKAKKERNEEVRNLVAFVRKRDKRVQEHTKAMAAKTLLNRQKQEELSKQRRLERKKEMDESGSQAEWAKFDNVQSELEQIEKNLVEQFGEDVSNSEEEEPIDDNLYCVACNKVFKNPKAFANHESSKKHKENVAILREMMLEEEEEFRKTHEDSEDNLTDLEELDDIILSDSSDEKIKKPKKKNKKSNVLSVVHDEEHLLEVSTPVKNDSDDNFDFDAGKKPKKTNKKKKTTNTEPSNSEVIPNIDIVSTNKNKKKTKKDKETVSEESVDTDHCCVTCKSNFHSKNKLFDHLKKTGHGVYLNSKDNKSKKSAREK